MNSLALLFAAATLGVDYGWQYDDHGKLEYLIQLEPSLIRSMENGLPITSELEPQVRGVRRFRITIGTGPLPREAIRGVSLAEPAPPAERTASAVVPLPPGDGSGAIGRPRLGGNDPPLANADRNAAQTSGEPNRLSTDGERIEQSAAKPAESPSDTADGNVAKNEPDNGEETGAAIRSPWFVGAIVALCASLGVNFYQGWNLKSARHRYYQLVDRLGLRPSGGSEGVSIVS